MVEIGKSLDAATDFRALAADFLHLPLSLMNDLVLLPVLISLQEVAPECLTVLRIEMVIELTLSLSLCFELTVYAK